MDELQASTGRSYNNNNNKGGGLSFKRNKTYSVLKQKDTDIPDVTVEKHTAFIF